MRKFLLRIRFWLIPAHSRREKLYHNLRLSWLVASNSGKRTFFLNRLPAWKRTLTTPQPRAIVLNQAVNAYRDWCHQHQAHKSELEAQQKSQADFRVRPLFSILMEIEDPDPERLNEVLKSIQAQTYPHWELCLVDCSSNRKQVSKYLEQLAGQDRRIKIKVPPNNDDAALHLNRALEMAGGEFVLLLEQDDLLAPVTLYAVANQLNQHPALDILYFDEDKISADGHQHHSPWFKPTKLSPDLLLSVNYLQHAVIRCSLIKESGGFDPSLPGAQAWDISLRLVEQGATTLHLPQVLYHARETSSPPELITSAAASRAAQSLPILDAVKACLEGHLHRLGYSQATVDFPSPHLTHVRWALPFKKASIIIPTKDNLDKLRPCLESIFTHTHGSNYEILLVDTGSSDPETLEYYRTLASRPEVNLIFDKRPFNFHRVCNLGARHASGEIFVFLNNDTEALGPEWLEELVGWAERPEVGIVGARLIRPDGTIQHAGLIIGLGGHGSHVFDGGREDQTGPFGSPDWYRDYQAITGACLAIRRELFEALHGFDEAYQVGYGDIDLCLRAVDAGYRVVYNPFARLLHHEGATRGFSQPPSDVLRASVRMMGRIQAGDPYFNPNLSRYQRVPAVAQAKEPPIPELILRILREFDLVSYDDLNAVDPLRWQVQLPFPARASANQKRLLVVSHELTRTGAPIILWQLCTVLAQTGYQITLLAPEDGPLHDNYIESKIPVLILPSLLQDARVVLPYLQDQDLGLLNTILCYRVAHAVKASNLPLLWWVHESAFGQQICQTLPGAAYAMRAADRLIFPSQATANLYTQYSQPENRQVIHSGVNITSPDAAIAGAPIEKATGKLWIIVIASIEPRKGQDVLLQALKMLPANISAGLECFIVGRPLEPGFSQKVIRSAESLGNVHILGELSAVKVKQYLEAADIFVLPSRDEALPLSILEAMAFSKAIIATRVGGM